MKKLLVGVMLGAVLLSGCSNGSDVNDKTSEVSESRFNVSHHVDEVEIIKDKETGCKYITLINYGNGTTVTISPLMKNSTEVDCEVE